MKIKHTLELTLEEYNLIMESLYNYKSMTTSLVAYGKISDEDREKYKNEIELINSMFENVGYKRGYKR